MTKRQRIVCSHIPAATVFADVGCDHGYMAKYALDCGLCERAYISDISRESLKKAETLLRAEIAAGRCFPVCADGMGGLPERCDCVLIAGLGGEEIVRILSAGELPEKFVLQPMKNAEKVRSFLLERGAKIVADYTFADGKYYDLIAGERAGGDEYSDYELEFGRDNLRTPSADFLCKMREESGKLRALLTRKMERESREEILRRLYRLEEITDAIEGDL